MPGRGTRPVRILLALALALNACDAGSDTLDLVGTVERTQVELVAPASEAIVSIDVQRGRHVTRGELLVRLDKTTAVAEVARAQAALAAARSAALVAQQELERVRRLFEGRVSSQQQLDRARLAYDEARARLYEAEALAVAARKRSRDLDLTSPVDGVVDQLPFETGERPPLGAVLAVVLSDARPWVRVWIPETTYVWARPGTPAEIAIDGLGRTLRGRVLDVARESEFTPHYALTERDRVHLVYETRVEIEDAPADLRPGLPARVRLRPPSGRPDAGASAAAPDA